MARIDAELRTIHTIARRVIERAALVRQELPRDAGAALDEALKLAGDAEALWRHATQIVKTLTREREAEAKFQESRKGAE